MKKLFSVFALTALLSGAAQAGSVYECYGDDLKLLIEFSEKGNNATIITNRNREHEKSYRGKIDKNYDSRGKNFEKKYVGFGEVLFADLQTELLINYALSVGDSRGEAELRSRGDSFIQTPLTCYRRD